jgi:hypothetical protein
METYIASDGYRWRYRHYSAVLSEGRQVPRARVVCIHGIQSHGGWYEGSCSWLSQAGFEVYFLDRRGSGLNEQDRGDAPGFRRLLDDLAEFLRSLRAGMGKDNAPMKDESGTAAGTEYSVLRTPYSVPGAQPSTPDTEYSILNAQPPTPGTGYPVPHAQPSASGTEYSVPGTPYPVHGTHSSAPDASPPLVTPPPNLGARSPLFR